MLLLQVVPTVCGVKLDLFPAARDVELDVCVGGGSQIIETIYIEEQVVSYAVTVNTFVAANTVLVIDNSIHVSITNAPVQVYTVVSGLSTVTSTTVATTSM